MNKYKLAQIEEEKREQLKISRIEQEKAYKVYDSPYSKGPFRHFKFCDNIEFTDHFYSNIGYSKSYNNLIIASGPAVKRFYELVGKDFDIWFGLQEYGDYDKCLDTWACVTATMSPGPHLKLGINELAVESITEDKRKSFFTTTLRKYQTWCEKKFLLHSMTKPSNAPAKRLKAAGKIK